MFLGRGCVDMGMPLWYKTTKGWIQPALQAWTKLARMSWTYWSFSLAATTMWTRPPGGYEKICCGGVWSWWLAAVLVALTFGNSCFVRSQVGLLENCFSKAAGNSIHVHSYPQLHNWKVSNSTNCYFPLPAAPSIDQKFFQTVLVCTGRHSISEDSRQIDGEQSETVGRIFMLDVSVRSCAADDTIIH